ncbi:MAG: 2,3-bisphosphoglycerate-dependent phosphoglycerate mutase [Candidatus Woesearchaeota archaeon]
MAKLIIVRHGESIWNKENKFTGWMDIDLSEKGIEEARNAGKILSNYIFDSIYISHMIRSIHTLQLILEETNDKRTKIIYHDDDSKIREREHHTGDRNKELNIYQSKAIAERYYGDLQGLNKAETAEKFGDEQVHLWRRSYDVRPPNGESLKDTLDRVIPYWEKTIKKDLQEGKTVLIVAHGNSLRAIVKYLEKISDENIPNYEIPTGVPIEYTLDAHLEVINKKELR